MRKTACILAALLLLVLPASAQRVMERTYVSTDKDVYVAGDLLWYSAFCLDAEKGTFSPVSCVAYVELHGAGAMVASGKVALDHGRGAGRLALPSTLPTGNYRLVAYTTQNKAEADYDYTGIASKVISVFNVLSNERLDGGVEIVEGSPVKPGMTEDKPGMTRGVMPGTDHSRHSGLDPESLDVVWQEGKLVVTNRGDQSATMSLSVFHDDGIPSNGNPTVSDFVSGCRQVRPRPMDNAVIPEYEGEIIRGHITGFSEEMMPKLVGKFAFISTPSDKSDVYASVIDNDGRVAFYTGNIYGNKEYICEIEGIDPSLNCFISLESPFVGARVEPAAPLKLSPSLREPLLARSVAMQLERKFTADTLFDLLPIASGGLFGETEIVYPLDDYTRFTTMEEVFIEFIPEIRARRWPDGSRDIQIRLINGTEPVFSRAPTLMLLDGVPVFDQQKIMDYDPLLVESIHIYPQTYYIGNRSFEGIVNFVTYKHTLPAFQFGANVRVVDYQGVSVPMAATGASLERQEGYPDYRQTIYWHPLLELAPGATVTLPVKTPDYQGRFSVVAEGISADGKPLEAHTSFVTK